MVQFWLKHLSAPVCHNKLRFFSFNDFHSFIFSIQIFLSIWISFSCWIHFFFFFFDFFNVFFWSFISLYFFERFIFWTCYSILFCFLFCILLILLPSLHHSVFCNSPFSFLHSFSPLHSQIVLPLSFLADPFAQLWVKWRVYCSSYFPGHTLR